MLVNAFVSQFPYTNPMYSIVVANHARRIYCLVKNGDGVEIVEFAWQGDPSDPSTYANYDRIGTVGISV